MLVDKHQREVELAALHSLFGSNLWTRHLACAMAFRRTLLHRRFLVVIWGLLCFFRWLPCGIAWSGKVQLGGCIDSEPECTICGLVFLSNMKIFLLLVFFDFRRVEPWQIVVSTSYSVSVCDRGLLQCSTSNIYLLGCQLILTKYSRVRYGKRHKNNLVYWRFIWKKESYCTIQDEQVKYHQRHLSCCIIVEAARSFF